MHKSLIFIILALTWISAFAAYTPSNYEIAPVSIDYLDTNFTNMSTSYPGAFRDLYLASITPGNLHLVSQKISLNSVNMSANNWNFFYRQLDTKTFAGIQNYTASIVAPRNVYFYNSYAIGFDIDSTSGASNLWAYQIPLTSGTTFPGRLQLSNNTNVNFTVLYISRAQIGNTVHVAYLAANFTVNITSFTVGATAPGTSFTLSTTFDSPCLLSVCLVSVSLAWGKALGNNQLFAVWIENGVLKDAVIDVSKRTVASLTVVPGYNLSKHGACSAIVTDEKLYGEVCLGFEQTHFSTGNYLYWVRTTANGTLVQIANYTKDTSYLAEFVPYGPYLAVFFRDGTGGSGINYVYELWNLDTFNTTYLQPRKQYLNMDDGSAMVPFRLGSDGLYTLLYTYPQPVPGTDFGNITNVQVGLLLGSSNSVSVPGGSYLASFFGFLGAQFRKLTKN